MRRREIRALMAISPAQCGSLIEALPNKCSKRERSRFPPRNAGASLKLADRDRAGGDGADFPRAMRGPH